MASIRDLVGAIRQRQTVPGVDAEDLAARIPGIIGPADELGIAAARGPLFTAVLEYRQGLAIASVLSADAILLVLVRPEANIGQLLFELRRNREQIAALV